MLNLPVFSLVALLAWGASLNLWAGEETQSTKSSELASTGETSTTPTPSKEPTTTKEQIGLTHEPAVVFQPVGATQTSANEELKRKKKHLIFLQWLVNKWGLAIGPKDPPSHALPPWVHVGIAGGELVSQVLKIPGGAAGGVIHIGMKGFELGEVAVNTAELIKALTDPRTAGSRKIQDQLERWAEKGVGGLTPDDVDDIMATARELASNGISIFPEKNGFFPK